MESDAARRDQVVFSARSSRVSFGTRREQRSQVASEANSSLRGCSAEHVGGSDLILNVEDALQQRKQLLGVL